MHHTTETSKGLATWHPITGFGQEVFLFLSLDIASLPRRHSRHVYTINLKEELIIVRRGYSKKIKGNLVKYLEVERLIKN